MPKKEYDWILGEAPPRIEPHSFAKHRVYEEYLNHYIHTLITNPAIPKMRLAVVDGFAGGGLYTSPKDGGEYIGSPLRLIRAAENATAEINQERKKPFQLLPQYYFIEKQQTNLDHLQSFLGDNGCGGQFGESIHLMSGAFTDRLDQVVQSIRATSPKTRAIFILDQYGYKDAPLPAIRKILSELPNAEVILTFMVDHLINYMADSTSWHKAAGKVGAPDLANRLLETLPLKEQDNAEWRRIAQFFLHQELVSGSGASYFTPFFITSSEANRAHWLVHLSNHPTARDVMTQLHWSVSNQFAHYGDKGLAMLGYNYKKDPEHFCEDMFAASGLDEYTFDGTARESSTQRLLDEIPRLLHENHLEGISFDQFFRLVANHTPVTKDQLRNVIGGLVQAGELERRGANREVRRSSTEIINDDVILPHRVQSFDFGEKPDLLRLLKRSGKV